jgi:phospho-N-acetylmuramoyl-pentapeptide-transferase
MLAVPRGREYFGLLLGGSTVLDITIILASIVASFTGFFVYNAYPAKIFLGDVGSLMIGALLCYVATLMGIELFYALMATLFIVEIFSTILQISYFKITRGKRLFRMAPFHHHLEKSGIPERRVVVMLWLFNLICCLLAMVFLYYSI